MGARGLWQCAGDPGAARCEAGRMRSRVLAELAALFAPPACAGCRAPLEDPAGGLCRGCRRRLPWLRGPRCERCGLPGRCAPCPAARAAFGRSWAPMAYAGPARDLVGALKFRGALALADQMAAEMAAAAPAGLLEGRVVVPVPAHPVRARRRGFDQAERLAARLSHRTGLPLDICLSRSGTAEGQLGKTRANRMRQGRIEFVAVGPVPESPVLVDDVHTTGATLDAAARALRLAGASEVVAVTYARTLRP